MTWSFPKRTDNLYSFAPLCYHEPVSKLSSMSKTLAKIRDTIVENYDPDQIILFGSRVWGKPHKWSDYDLFVLKKGARKRMVERTLPIRRAVRENNIWAPFDILIYNQKELKDILSTGSQLFHDILKRGKKIYEKY